MLFLDRVAIVTGAASGIGLAVARKFGGGGASVALVDLHADPLSRAEAQVRQAGAPRTLTVACDVASRDQVTRAVNSVVDHFGRLDVLVNNAGVMIFKPLEEHTAEDWHRVLGVDLLGAFFFTREAFRHMRHGGSIVNVSSIHAVETTPLVTSYAAAKAAVLSLTRSAAIEGKAKGIRVNAVLPGAVDTPMLRENPNVKAGLEVIRQGDVGSADDVASSIAFLASEEARFIQGASLRVDGGRLAKL